MLTPYERFCMGQNTVVINIPTNNRFLLEVLQSNLLKQQFDFSVAGSSQKTLSLKAIKEAFISQPLAEEQNSIISILEAHDSRTRSEEAYLDKLKEQKKGLMHDLFTGRVRVTGLKEIPA